MRIVIVDDHPLVVHGITAVIRSQPDMEVVGSASNLEEALGLLACAQPDLALIDLRLPGEHGMDLVARGRAVAPSSRFVVLTSYCSPADARRALDAGIDGYILKESPPEEIISALRRIAGGERWMSAAVEEMAAVSGDDGITQLTPREREVLAALARGWSNREIAERLYVSEFTVKKHVSQILDKLGVADRTQAALYAVARGFGSPGA